MFKKIRVLSVIFILASFLLPKVMIASNIQEQMIQDLNVVKYHLSIKYAPAEWKNEYLGWSLESSYNQAKMRILNENPSTPKDYQRILSQFLASTQDYHVNIQYHSTAWSFFPFKVKKINNRYYFAGFESQIALSSQDIQFFDISDEDQEMISKNLSGISIGDEILELDGRPIQNVIEELIDQNFNGDRTDTAYELVVRNLFFRRASLGQDIPEGSFKITLKSQKTKQTITRKFPWIHREELVFNHPLRDRYASQIKNWDFSSETSIEMMDRLLTKDFSVGIAKDLKMPSVKELLSGVACAQAKGKNEIKSERDGREKGFLPPLGKIIWESSKKSELYAYLYRQPVTNKLIGYIYLPSFSKLGEEAEEYLIKIVAALKIFQLNADGLVIDITDNTGGSMMFMYGLLSVLTDKPLKVPTHREILIQEDVKRMAILSKQFEEISNFLNSEDEEKSLSGYSFTEKLFNQIKNYASTILETWESGEVFTQPLYLFGIDEVMPHPTFNLKNKPIVVLVNSYCFSCGDFFPAILQDNQKAIIFGQRTAGAGGYVKPHFHTSRFGVSGYSLTASIAYRMDGTPIENLGVTPDIPYSITEKDLRENYSDYINKVNGAMKNLLQ